MKKTSSMINQWKLKLTFPLFLMTLCLLSSAPAGAEIEDSSVLVKDPGTVLEWQKVDLEDRFQTKLQKALDGSLSPSQFVLSVTILLKDKVKPAPSPSVSPSPSPKPSPTPTETSDSESDSVELNGARLSLGKLDLDTPKFKKVKEEAVIASLPILTNPLGPVVEEEANLFKSIEKVKVGIFLDQAVPDSKKEIVEKVVRNLTASLGQDNVELTIEKVDLAAKEESDLKKWLIEFKLPIGFLLGIFIISLFITVLMLSLFKGYRSLEDRKISVMEAQNSRDQTQADSRSPSDSEPVQEAATRTVVSSGANFGGSGLVSGNLDGLRQGFDKYRALLKQSPDQASNLIKQWVKAPMKEAREALVSLPQVLSTEEFLVLFQHLTLEDRKAWKKILSHSMPVDNMDGAGVFVAAQIVDSILESGPMIDEELKRLISELEVSESMGIAADDPELGGVLVNLLPTTQVSQLYSMMPPELANRVTLASLNFSDSELQNKTNRLKESIQATKSIGKPQAVPFLEKASDLISQLDPDKEASIFNALAEAGQFQLLQSTAQQFFPAELSLGLPGSFLKATLERMPLTRRAELLTSRNEADRSILLDAIGKPGSKLRDLIDVEVQQVQDDPLRARRAEKLKDVMWKEFIQLVRVRIRSNELAADQAEPVLAAWLSDKSGGQTGEMSRGSLPGA